MIIIINDSAIYLDSKGEVKGGQGGTAAFISGFLQYFLKENLIVGLLGNFQGLSCIFPVQKIIRAKSSNTFLIKLLLYFLFEKKNIHDAVYYCHRPDHLAISLIAKGSHILHLHGQPHTTIKKDRNFLKKMVFNRLEKIAINGAELIIATDLQTANLYKWLYPVSQHKIIVIPTGVSLEEFNPRNEVKPFSGIDQSTTNIAFVGRLSYPKKVMELITWFDMYFGDMPQVHLWIAGTGNDEYRLKLASSKLVSTGNIHFVGYLSRSEVKRLIHSVDAGVLFSNNEGSPIVIKEFLAAGKPVLVNIVGDIDQYVVEGVNGFIIDLKNPESFRLAVEKIMKSGKGMVSACVESMLPYDQDKIYHMVYQSIGQNHK